MVRQLFFQVKVVFPRESRWVGLPLILLHIWRCGINVSFPCYHTEREKDMYSRLSLNENESFCYFIEDIFS